MTPVQANLLWDAIGRYTTACGGDPSAHVYGNTMRQQAVTDIESAVRSVADAAAAEEREGCIEELSALYESKPDSWDEWREACAIAMQAIRSRGRAQGGGVGT